MNPAEIQGRYVEDASLLITMAELTALLPKSFILAYYAVMMSRQQVDCPCSHLTVTASGMWPIRNLLFSLDNVH